MTLLASWGKTAAVVGLVADFGLIKNIHPKLYFARHGFVQNKKSKHLCVVQT